MGPGDVGRRARLLRSVAAAAILAAAFSSSAATLEATSSDGRWRLRADNEARVLLAVDAASGEVRRRIPVADKRGAASRVAHIADAPPRRSFVVLLADVAEAWELTYDPAAEPVYQGLVHDYRMREGIVEAGPLPVRRIELDLPLSQAVFAPGFDVFVGRAGPGRLHVVSLLVRRRIETLTVDGDPRVDGAAAWQCGGPVQFALPDGVAPVLHRIDGGRWQWRTPLELPGNARRVRVDGCDALQIELRAGGTLRVDAGRP
jgi:hypothetical protein